MRGMLAPLSPNEESTLRRIALGAAVRHELPAVHVNQAAAVVITFTHHRRKCRPHHRGGGVLCDGDQTVPDNLERNWIHNEGVQRLSPP